MTINTFRRDVVADGLHVPEGPALMPDGSLVFTEQTAGRISRLTDAGVQQHAYTGGAPNSCVPGPAGELYVCQNGGKVGAWVSSDPRTPGIYAVSPDGSSVDLVTDSVLARKLSAPNDLAFAPDGRLYFTDPAQAFNPVNPADAGTIYALGGRTWDPTGSTAVAADQDSTNRTPGAHDPRSDRGGRVRACGQGPRPGGPDLAMDVGPVYCNGLAFGTKGELIWVESYTRRVRTLIHAEMVTLTTLPEEHVPDGFAVAEDGRMFIASCGAHCIDVVSPEGRLEESIFLDERANPTNCCFDDAELFVTDFGMDFEGRQAAGRLWRIQTDATGIAPTYGSLRTKAIT